MQKHTFFLPMVFALFLLGGACSPAQTTGEEAAEKDQPEAASTDASNERKPTTSQQANFSKTLSLQGVQFAVNASNGKLVIQPGGLEDNSPWEHQIQGRVTDAQIEDMNGDGAPEIAVFTRSGPDKKADVIAYTCYGKKSMGQIYFPGLQNVPDASQGYQGYDELAIVETTLVQRFPVFENGQRTGTTRQIQYKLADGENSRVFRVDKVMEY